jgi:hypothetical protein
MRSHLLVQQRSRLLDRRLCGLFAVLEMLSRDIQQSDDALDPRTIVTDGVRRNGANLSRLRIHFYPLSSTYAWSA